MRKEFYFWIPLAGIHVLIYLGLWFQGINDPKPVTEVVNNIACDIEERLGIPCQWTAIGLPFLMVLGFLISWAANIVIILNMLGAFEEDFSITNKCVFIFFILTAIWLWCFSAK